MKETLNYKFKKPDKNDYVKIEDLNENTDNIDKELKNINDRVNNIKIPEVPVKGVNGKNGYVVLKAQDIKTSTGNSIEKELSKDNLKNILGLKQLAYEPYLNWSEIHSKPTIPSKISDLKNDSDFAKKSDLNNKVDKQTGKGLSTNDFSNEYKNKLEKIKINSDGTASTVQYVHPDTHPASMITTDSEHRFVSDSEKEKWNNNKCKVESVNGKTGNVTLSAKEIIYKNNFNIYQGLETLTSRISSINEEMFVKDEETKKIYNPEMKKEYYVNCNNGNDENDGSKNKPFRTIQKAIDTLPKFINQAVTINIANGDYNEEIILSGFINFNQQDRDKGITFKTSNARIKHVQVYSCICYIKFEGIFDFYGYAEDDVCGAVKGSFYVYDSNLVNIDKIQSKKTQGIKCYNSTMIATGEINSEDIAIENFMGTIFAYDITGEAKNIGYKCQAGGIIVHLGNKLTAKILMQKGGGGRIESYLAK